MGLRGDWRGRRGGGSWGPWTWTGTDAVAAVRELGDPAGMRGGNWLGAEWIGLNASGRDECWQT